MATGKTNCQLADCRRAVSAYCYCCKRNVCTNHFLEHIERMKAKIDPLANEVNNTMEGIQELTVEQLSRPIFTQLNQWQKNMHELIDDIHAKKTKEIEEIVKVNREKFDEHRRTHLNTMMKLQEDVKQVAEDGDVTFEQIEAFESQLREIDASLAVFENSFLSIETRAFGEGLVTVACKLNEPAQAVSRAKPRPPIEPSKSPFAAVEPNPAAAPKTPFFEQNQPSGRFRRKPIINPPAHSPEVPSGHAANPSTGPFLFGGPASPLGGAPSNAASSSLFGSVFGSAAPSGILGVTPATSTSAFTFATNSVTPGGSQVENSTNAGVFGPLFGFGRK